MSWNLTCRRDEAIIIDYHQNINSSIRANTAPPCRRTAYRQIDLLLTVIKRTQFKRNTFSMIESSEAASSLVRIDAAVLRSAKDACSYLKSKPDVHD